MSDIRAFVYLVRLQDQLEVAIRFEALASQLPMLLVGVDDFSDSGIALKLRWQTTRQIDQQVCRYSGFQAQMDCRRRIHRLFIKTHLVGDEGTLVKSPEQFIQRLGISERVADDDDLQVFEVGFFSQAAGERPALSGSGTFEHIKINALRHDALAR